MQFVASVQLALNDRSTSPDLRQRLGCAQAFLSGPKSGVDLARLGNRIICTSKSRKCQFSLLTAVLLLLKCDDRLEDDARQVLQGYLTTFAQEP